jgi:hypothetical protein
VSSYQLSYSLTYSKLCFFPFVNTTFSLQNFYGDLRATKLQHTTPPNPNPAKVKPPSSKWLVSVLDVLPPERVRILRCYPIPCYDIPATEKLYITLFGSINCSGHELLLVHGDEACSVGQNQQNCAAMTMFPPSSSTILGTNLGKKTKSSSRATRVQKSVVRDRKPSPLALGARPRIGDNRDNRLCMQL